jgi:hypothetical protein
MNKQFKAEGTEGVILIYQDLDAKCQVVFRIYEKGEDGLPKKDEKGHVIFKDYNVRHHDVKVKLLNGYFYETDKGNFLDYPRLNYQSPDLIKELKNEQSIRTGD